VIEGAEVPIAAPQRQTVTTRVRQQLLADIRSGRFRVGDALPTVREMERLYGASQTPIREAMQSLYQQGIVSISPRRGAVVTAPPIELAVDFALLSAALHDYGDAREIFQFRVAVEGAAAELCARVGTAAQATAVNDVLNQADRAIAGEDIERFHELDVAFHRSIADSCGNELFRAVTTTLDVLFVRLRQSMGRIPGASALALAEHRAIAAAIAARDAATARRAAEDHVTKSWTRMATALDLPNPSAL
jgi:GntR family transcriptional repressor for pyruvate dehydrogenase complex